MGISVRPWGSDKSGFQKMYNEVQNRKQLKKKSSKDSKQTKSSK